MDKSFAQILSEKLDFSTNSPRRLAIAPASDPMINPRFSQTLDPSSLGFLLGKIPQTRFQPEGQVPRVYPYRSRKQESQIPNTQNLRPEPVSPPQPRPQHKLSSLQGLSLSYFQQQCGLVENFFETELKAAFHVLAKKLHPDRGGSAELFRELKENFDELHELFAQKTA